MAGAWRKSLEVAGGSGNFALIEDNSCLQTLDATDRKPAAKRKRTSKESAAASNMVTTSSDIQFAPRNKVLRNKSDPESVRQAKEAAQRGEASILVRQWLFPPKKPKTTGLTFNSLKRFSDAKPPVLLQTGTIRDAIQHLSKDRKLAAIIERVGEEGLLRTCGEYHAPTQASLFDHCVRAISFIMVSQDAGNVSANILALLCFRSHGTLLIFQSFLRRLSIKIGVCVENMPKDKRIVFLREALQEVKEGGRHADLTPKKLLDLLLAGSTGEVVLTVSMVEALVQTCLVVNDQQSGYPHLCGQTFPCGKNDDWGVYLQKARDQVADSTGTKSEHVSAGYSKSKADFLIALVRDFRDGTMSATKLAQASDREAASMLLKLSGFGDWCAGQVLVQFLRRADVMWYGDLTVRNYLNLLYDVNHNEDISATELESAADFPDTATNRNLLDQVALKNGWHPYRSVVCLLMYHLEEENLTLV